MNKIRRGKIDRIIKSFEILTVLDNQNSLKLIENAITQIEEIRDEEQDCFDNLSEGLQCTMRGEAMEEAVDNLDEAINALEELMDAVDPGVDDIGDAVESAIDYLSYAME